MNILIIGDVMIDVNHICQVNRNAPEAKIPIYDVIDTQYKLGGAGNVVKNLHHLKMNVEIITILGNDWSGLKIKQIFDNLSIKNKCIFDENRISTQKIRLFYNEQIVNRHDIETITPISIEIETQIYSYIFHKIDNVNAIIISDYNKGIMTSDLCQKIIKLANTKSIYTFIDPKIYDYKKYENCFLFKPNLLEAQQITGISYNNENIQAIFQKLKSQINASHIIITANKNGMYVNNEKNHVYTKNVSSIDVVDVTGAGDIALCVIVYIWLKEHDFVLASQIANEICVKSIQSIGNYDLTLQDIYNYYFQNTKIIYENETSKLSMLHALKQENKIVFTNGCFDIIHSAHIQLLQYCKKQGDILIVGLNSDESIQNLKGPTRPINDLSERIDLLLHLHIINYIVIFHDDTPEKILNIIRPHVLIKGGDYNKETLIGREYAENVLIFDYIKNKSTSNIIQKIKNVI